MGDDPVRHDGCDTQAAGPLAGAPDAGTRTFLRSAAALGASLILPAGAALAQAADGVRQPTGQAIGVLFPDLGDPYRRIFEEIVAGIELQARQPVRAWPVSPALPPAELAAAVKRSGARILVALGRQGLKAAAALDGSMQVVIGGVSSVPDGERQFGVCLTPDPALLFARLKILLPATRRVLVIHHPVHNAWLLRLAREAAAAQALELLVSEARDLAGSARLYEAAFAGADRKRDAVWLPTDPATLDEGTIMPIVLRESWNRGVPVFSSGLLHVNKGALFSLYPNNSELGRTLGTLASALLEGKTAARGVTPLRDVYAALNIRTANHLGITVDARMRAAFQTIFPTA